MFKFNDYNLIFKALHNTYKYNLDLRSIFARI